MDIGFSALIAEKKKEKGKGIFGNFESVWASLEVFNLLQIENTISHIWVKDNFNFFYAFENHLTSRRINLRLAVRI